MFVNILILILFIFVYLIQGMFKPKKFPPGPRWYPLFGCSSKVYAMTRKYGSQYTAFQELSKEYCTDTLGLNFAGELVVVFFGEKSVREVMTTDAFDGRPDNFFIRMRCFGQRAGISFVDGPIWQIHRRFTVKHLRVAGFGKSPMEIDIQDAMTGVVEYIKQQHGKPLYPKDFLPLPVLNVLWKCATGEKINEAQWNDLQELLSKRSQVFNVAGGLLNRAPWCRFLFPGYSGYSTLVEVNKGISAIIEDTIRRHKKKVVQAKDFIYAFMEEMDQKTKTFTEEQLRVVCIDLILAGSMTTAKAVQFALLQLLRDQDIQKKIHEEIDKVLGNLTPCWNDHLRLPYTSAFLQELQRYYTVIPLAGPRRALKKMVVDGYIIPKDTTILMSTGHIHFNPNLWENPDEFRPERFLDEQGNFKHSEHFYGFSIGHRRCPGDMLARSFLFVTVVGILQQFRITCPDEQMPSNVPDVGLISSPKPYRAVFTNRK